MKIWLISAFEPTPVDNSRPMRFMGIANQAVNDGHDVTFFTTTFNHYQKKHRYHVNKVVKIRDNYRLIFLHSKGYQKNISVGRMLAHYDFALALLENFKTFRQKPDVIFISLPPISSVLKVCKWANENNVPVVVDIIDPWPDVFLKALPGSLKGVGKLAFTPFYLQLKKIFGNCSGISAISQTYIDWSKKFSTHDVPVKVSYPAVDLTTIQNTLADLPSETGGDDALRVIYTGSLASSYDIETILDAAEILEKELKGLVKFVIAGTGPKASLIEKKMELLDNIEYLGWIGQDELLRQYAIADLGLTQHMPGATQSVTYKFFDYLGAGLPILNSLEGEMAHLIEEHHVGINNTSGNGQALAANIRMFLNNAEKLIIYKKNAVALTREKGDTNKVYSELLQFLQSIVLQQPNPISN